MDLDGEELKATREKSADEMFKELELEKQDRKYGIIYECEGKYIGFNHLSKTINIHNYITMQELQAINKKVLELGWLDER